MSNTRILVLGAGGTGGYFGGRLHQAGAEVTFLVREARAAALARDGLVIETPRERVVFPVKARTAAQLATTFDVILLSCKAYDLADSIAAIRPAMGAETVIVPLLNGMTHLDDLDAAFGKAHVMGGLCQIMATLTCEGVVKTLSAHQKIIYGARDPAQEAAASALSAAFAKTSVEWKCSTDITQDLWEKVVFLSALAAVTCLMRGSIGDVLAAPGGREFIERTLAANLDIAMREGHPMREEVASLYRSVLTQQGAPHTASMLRDIENGNRIEADHIVGFMLKRARHHGVDDGPLAMAYAHLKAYERRREREAALLKAS
jgi:2-dehydropantoate 2-reductase